MSVLLTLMLVNNIVTIQIVPITVLVIMVIDLAQMEYLALVSFENVDIYT